MRDRAETNEPTDRCAVPVSFEAEKQRQQECRAPDAEETREATTGTQQAAVRPCRAEECPREQMIAAATTKQAGAVKVPAKAMNRVEVTDCAAKKAQWQDPRYLLEEGTDLYLVTAPPCAPEHRAPAPAAVFI